MPIVLSARSHARAGMDQPRRAASLQAHAQGPYWRVLACRRRLPMCYLARQHPAPLEDDAATTQTPSVRPRWIGAAVAALVGGVALAAFLAPAVPHRPRPTRRRGPATTGRVDRFGCAGRRTQRPFAGRRRAHDRCREGRRQQLPSRLVVPGFDLERFVAAQAPVWPAVRAELQAGHKQPTGCGSCSRSSRCSGAAAWPGTTGSRASGRPTPISRIPCWVRGCGSAAGSCCSCVAPRRRHLRRHRCDEAALLPHAVHAGQLRTTWCSARACASTTTTSPIP